MGLRSYIIKRIIKSFVLIIFVLTLNFIIFELMPGDPMQFFVSAGKMKPEMIEEVKRIYGLEKPPLERYGLYVYNMLTWNFGYSFYTTTPVAQEIAARIPNTLLLVGLSTALSIVIGVILGVFAAQKRGGTYDTVSVIASLTTYSLPSFWIGMILILIFHVYLGWFPGAGAWPREWAVNPPQNILEIITGRMQYLFLPLLTLTIFSYGGYLLLTRATMLETLTEDYITTAKAKGLSQRAILFKHALKNASLPLITNAALAFGYLFTGAIITEQVFTYPGLGEYLWKGVVFKDFPVIQAMFYIIALAVIIANFIADLAYGIVDPRIKYE
ncbi:MAG: ABC transporter permease [Candidatus Bathyarchaeia archaeon]